MKHFKNYIAEENKRYSREEIIDWCKINVLDFDIDYINDIPNTWSKNGFNVKDSIQTLFYKSNKQLVIKSNDTELINITFSCQNNGYDIHCEKLKKLNTDNFELDSDLFFTKTNNLDFSDVDVPPNITTHFIECNKFNPKQIKKINICVFDCSENSTLSDFANYDNSPIMDLTFNTYFRYKNITNILSDNNFYNFYTTFANGIYSLVEIRKLNTIFNTFLHKFSKKNYIMDFTVEMIDSGFEDEL